MFAGNTLTMSGKRVFDEVGIDRPPSTVRHTVATYIQHMVVASEIWTKRQLSDLLRHKGVEATQGTYAKSAPPAGPYRRFLKWVGGQQDWRMKLPPLVLGELMRI